MLSISRVHNQCFCTTRITLYVWHAGAQSLSLIVKLHFLKLLIVIVHYLNYYLYIIIYFNTSHFLFILSFLISYLNYYLCIIIYCITSYFLFILSFLIYYLNYLFNYLIINWPQLTIFNSSSWIFSHHDVVDAGRTMTWILFRATLMAYQGNAERRKPKCLKSKLQDAVCSYPRLNCTCISSQCKKTRVICLGRAFNSHIAFTIHVSSTLLILVYSFWCSYWCPLGFSVNHKTV